MRRSLIRTTTGLVHSFSTKNSFEFNKYAAATQHGNFDWLSDISSNFNINEACQESGESLLSLTLDQKKIEIASFLIKEYKADFRQRNNDGFSSLELATLFADGDSQSFLKEVTPQSIRTNAEAEKYISAVRAKFFVKLFYSAKDCPIFHDRFFNFIEVAFPKTSIDEESKNFILEVAASVRNGRRLEKNSKSLQIESVPYQAHSAYFIIERDANNAAINISYCDGNCPIGSGGGEVVFLIDGRKVGALRDKLSDHLHKIFANGSEKEFYENGGKKIKNALASIVHCDEKNEPFIVRENIPINPQVIGNCVPKSFFILVRAIYQRLNQEVAFGYDEYGYSTPGQEIYDRNKLCLRKEILQNLLELSSSNQDQSLHHFVALEALNIAFLKSIKNGEIDVIEPIYKTLKANKFNFAAENFSEISKLFLLHDIAPETIKYLCDETSMLQDRDSNNFSFLDKIKMLNFAHKSENFNLLAENIIINSPKSSLAKFEQSPLHLIGEEAKNSKFK